MRIMDDGLSSAEEFIKHDAQRERLIKVNEQSVKRPLN